MMGGDTYHDSDPCTDLHTREDIIHVQMIRAGIAAARGLDHHQAFDAAAERMFEAARARKEAQEPMAGKWCGHVADLDKMVEQCFCDARGIGAPGVSCGDCPTRDYKRVDSEGGEV